MEEKGIAGPIFVSIGDADKLNTFLDLNEFIPRDQAFVDDYTFGAYKQVGFGRFDEQDPEIAKQVKMTAPDLGGWKGAWKYMSNVAKISPIPPDMKFGEVPEGVLRLGGTFIVKGEDVVYQWSDRLPGDHPDLTEVLEIAKSNA